MKGKKQFLASVLYHTGILNLVRSTSTRRVIVFNYHRIRPDTPGFRTDFDDGVYGPTASEFERQVAWLKHNTLVLSEGELIALAQSQQSLPAMASAITFDDGYRDNYDLAYPILKRLGAPAIFFIPTNRRLGWWDIIAYLVKKTSRVTIQSVPREQAIPHLLRRMKLEPHEKTANLLSELADECGIALPTGTTELMTWDQIREVSRNGIAIGSHTHSHRVLATIAPKEQREEMQQSKAILERELGMPVRSISYPVGNYQHFTPESQRLAAECGYALGFSFNTGVNSDQPLAAYDVKRVGPPDTLTMLASMTMMPGLFV